jgi:outer membrane protein assembly factor BamB
LQKSLISFCLVLLVSSLLLPVAEGSGSWPSFRGPSATGIGDGLNPPTRWSGETGENILWRVPIPGLAHSSPVVWGDKVFITSAVSSIAEPYLRVGLFGESPDHPEDVIHHYRLYCIDRMSGKIIWERTAHSGIPQLKRHIKSSHASSSPATDGKHVIVHFGSEGLYAYDMKGNQLWKVDLGFLDSGAFNAPELKWGYGSSPFIYQDKVIVLCDVNNQSFITALELKTGKEIWRTLRDEVPTWGTPTVHESEGRVQVIVNGWHHIGGYDVDTGEELWKLTGGGDVPVPTPIVAHGLIFITNAHGRVRPIYAIRESAAGDISLADGATANEYVAWANLRRGAYMPTPLVYGSYLYVNNNNGILTSYQAKTGEQVYRERIAGRRSAYSASPVAADGHLYFTDEFGGIHVIKAGPQYQHVSSNPMGEICMATPAIADGMLLVRGAKHLFAIAETDKPLASIVKEAKAAKAAKAEDVKVTEAEKESQPPATKEDGELTAVEILRRLDAASKAVESVSYDSDLKGSEAAESLGWAKISITATGYQDFLPGKFRMQGTALPQGAEEPIQFTAGSDGNSYYLLDPGTKTVHADLETGVFGPFAGAVFRSMVIEFHHPVPFDAEINGHSQELRGSQEIVGEDCYVVHVVYTAEPLREATWYISKKDFLPRARKDYFPMGEAGRGILLKTLSNVVVDPKVEPGFYDLKLPEGYKKSDQPAS